MWWAFGGSDQELDRAYDVGSQRAARAAELVFDRALGVTSPVPETISEGELERRLGGVIRGEEPPPSRPGVEFRDVAVADGQA